MEEMHKESLRDFLKRFNKAKLQTEEYSFDIILAALVNVVRHLRQSIGK